MCTANFTMNKFRGQHKGRTQPVCKVCSYQVEIFNNDEQFSWDMHRQEQYHIDAVQGKGKTKTLDIQAMQHFFGSKKHITQWGEELERFADDQSFKKDRNEAVKDAVMEVFRNVYQGNINILMFGSRITCLTTKDSGDLDLFIDTSEDEDKPITNVELENWILNKAAKYMKDVDDLNWANVNPVLSCRTPVLKALHLPTRMQCDVTVMGRLGVNNTQLMSLYLKNIPLFRQTILVVREWSLEWNFDKNINNYALSLLILFYFQIEGYAASVNDLNFESSTPTIQDVSGYDCVDYEKIDYKQIYVKNIGKLNLSDILYQFFQYYATFDFHNDVVCPLLGRPLKRKLFEKENFKKLPSEMHTYVTNLKKRGEEFQIDSAICIQDPIDLPHNLTKSTKKTFLHSFIGMCSAASEALKTLQ